MLHIESRHKAWLSRQFESGKRRQNLQNVVVLAFLVLRNQTLNSVWLVSKDANEVSSQ